MLDKLVWVFVPVFTVDGHERCGAWNRPTQRGTEQMGWRTTAQNFNLNRDDVKADAPEMQAMLQLVQQWDPLMYVDLHVTDGAKFEHDVPVQVEPAHAGDATLQRDGTRWRDAVLADLKNRARCRCRMTRRSCTKTTLAPALHTMCRRRVFARLFPAAQPLRHVGGNAFVEGLPHARASHPQCHRLGAATGCTQRRAVAHRRSGCRSTRHAPGWHVRAVEFAAGPQARTVAFRGYAYTRTPSPISGALMTRYDESKPQIWKVPLRDQIKPDVVVDAPRGGYLVPAAQAAL